MEDTAVGLVALLIWAGLYAGVVYGTYAIAKRNGRNTGTAILMGVLFGLFALIAYAIIGQPKAAPVITDHVRR